MEPQQQENISVHTPAETPSSSPKKSSISVPAAIITGAVLIGIALVLSGRTGNIVKNNGTTNPPTEEVTPAEPIALREGDHVRGNLATAEVVIVEYSDSDCPFCQRFHVTMQDILKKYGTKVAWVYRHFPLDMHPNAKNEAVAAECVAQLGGTDAFWSYLDQVVDITVTPEKSAAILTNTATGLGIDAAAFNACTTNPATTKIVADQIAEAQAAGAKGTPYNIAIAKDGTRTVIAGAYPLEEMTKIIDGLLKK